MPDNAIMGARYRDTTFEQTFIITNVKADTDKDIAEDEEITVVMDYEDVADPLTIDLATFKTTDDIELVEVPA